MPNETCASCKHFIGGGDFNLCCDLKYDLCYRYTPACEQYMYSEATVQALIEQDRKLEEYIAKRRQEAR